jgi:hypothetical protein
VVPLALVVPKDAPYSTVADMVHAARTPKGLLFASAGTGTPGHFAGELLKLASHGNITQVPYKGAGPALADLLGGHVDCYFPGFPAALPFVKNNQMKLLAVSTAQRAAGAPDVPTVAEAAGIKDFDFSLWAGFFAPRGTRKEIVSQLNPAINEVLALPDIKAPTSFRCPSISLPRSSSASAGNICGSSRIRASSGSEVAAANSRAGQSSAASTSRALICAETFSNALTRARHAWSLL